MQSEDSPISFQRRRRWHPAAVLILLLAVVSLSVSVTEQLRRESSPTPIFISQTGTPNTELVAEFFSIENAPPDLRPLSDGEESDLAVAAVSSVQPAVITVQRSGSAPVFGSSANQGDQGEIGSGVIVSADGYALASLRTTGTDGDLHVVFADGGVAGADVVAIDEALQVVLLKIDGEMPAVAELAGYDSLLGERVFAIGSALDDFFSTVTGGIIGATGATLPASGNWLPVRGVIQHDAAINQGNEGGPLLDLNGNVIGINIGSVTSENGEAAEGWSFAVPVLSLTQLLAVIA
jgi:S1-C subfamily serine protease